MPKKINSLIIFALAATILVPGVAVFTPHPAIAQECPQEGTSSGFGIFNKSLVPCGVKNSCGARESCTLCHFIILVKNIYDLLLSLLIIVALVFLTIGGVVYIVSSGNSSLKSTAKGIITKTLTGFAVFLLSWLIVYTILLFISANPDGNSLLGRGGSWYQFTCNTTSTF